MVSIVVFFIVSYFICHKTVDKCYISNIEYLILCMFCYTLLVYYGHAKETAFKMDVIKDQGRAMKMRLIKGEVYIQMHVIKGTLEHDCHER